MHKAILFLGVATLLLTNCKVGRNKQDLSRCDTLGTFVDYSHIDGCTYLIELENGDKLLPATILDTSFLPEDGMKIMFGYEILPEAASLCMAETRIVEVICIQRLEP